jgi:hypothetical protein
MYTFFYFVVFAELHSNIEAIAIQKIVKIYGQSVHGELPHNDCVFYDLGSGVGKAVIAASLMYNFTSCCGIEILESLHRGSKWVLEAYEAQVVLYVFNDNDDNDSDDDDDDDDDDYIEIDMNGCE